ncbi:hypothetical protein [Tichowtungia aerotolerans]|uniref:Uncharacterized protein n=1 Tax=Tichowtungia aerotolerans TaxID=2697043 RepID=A0A6P1M3M3_9BACT|nr:hypothetical protein [Tichowtungia aerotolerans]QHI68421.1 hypothetical protein GT409_02770 [Tichowtungia aerotolerans]
MSDRQDVTKLILISPVTCCGDGQSQSQEEPFSFELIPGNYFLGISIKGDDLKNVEILGFNFYGKVKEDDRIKVNPKWALPLDEIVSIPLSASKMRLRQIIKMILKAHPDFLEGAAND